MAKINTKGITDWADKFQQDMNRQELTIQIELEPKDSRALEAITDPIWFKGVLEDFVQENLLGPQGEIRREFEERSMAGQEYMPRYWSRRGLAREDASDGSRREEVVDMTAGFSALWQAINTTNVEMTGTGTTIGIGNMSRIMGLRLSDYMGGNATNSQYNSLFIATEYGTGIEENVGGGNVRLSGPSKSTKVPGAWYYKTPGRWGQGGLFTGQKAFHFLYDARSRVPRSLYTKMIRERLPQYITAALRARMNRP